MTTTIIGMFQTTTAAQETVQDLLDQGYPREDISMIAREALAESATAPPESEFGRSQGARSGAVGGSLVGGSMGLLVGVDTFVLAGLGAAVVSGPLGMAIATALATTVAGAGLGAAVGGLMGALVGAGVSEDKAAVYTEGLRRGATLVAIKVEESTVPQVEALMQQHGALDVEEQADQWRKEGWQSRETPTEPTSGNAWEQSSKAGTLIGTASGIGAGAAIGSVGGPVGAVVGGVTGAALGAGVGAAGDAVGERSEETEHPTSEEEEVATASEATRAAASKAADVAQKAGATATGTPINPETGRAVDAQMAADEQEQDVDAEESRKRQS